MQWEGSPYYHNFVALALTLAAEILFKRRIDLYNYTAPNGISLKSLWDALIPLSDSQGHIIRRRDGAHWRNGPFDRELRATYEIAYVRTGDSSYGWLLSQLERRELKDAAEPEQKSVNYPNTGLAVLRKNGQMVTLEYGQYGGEHGHYDKLSLYIPGWTDDPGTPQYGIEERRTWYQQTAAHNTIVVDNMSQAACAGKLVEFDDSSAVAVCETAYSGVQLKREVSLHDDGNISDVFNIKSDFLHVYDWILHGAGTILAENIDLSPCKRSLSNEGASRFIHIEQCGELEAGKPAELIFMGEYGELHIKLLCDKPAEILTGYAPGVSEAPMVKRPVLVLRINSKAAEITALYTRKQNG
jgi:oligo-alginate lyase